MLSQDNIGLTHIKTKHGVAWRIKESSLFSVQQNVLALNLKFQTFQHGRIESCVFSRDLPGDWTHPYFWTTKRNPTTPILFPHPPTSISLTTNQTTQSIIQTIEKALSKSERTRKAVTIYKNDPNLTLRDTAKLYDYSLQSFLNHLRKTICI
jgi:hypothetical protein